ncbi:hypothetical protein OIU78_004104 [Salix suchowensis]|nr:hypothetical protein OIU78_004104 [Salix suchowensis]
MWKLWLRFKILTTPAFLQSPANLATIRSKRALQNPFPFIHSWCPRSYAAPNLVFFSFS